MSDKPRIRVVSAAIIREGRYLITQRTDRAVLPGLWEFPGGKVESGETDEQALQRELRHRLDLEVQVCESISETAQEYASYVVDLHLYRCELGPRNPKPVAVQDLAWATSAEFDRYEFAPADEESMRALLFEDD